MSRFKYLHTDKEGADATTLANRWLEDNPDIKIVKWESHNIRTEKIGSDFYSPDLALIVEYESRGKVKISFTEETIKMLRDNIICGCTPDHGNALAEVSAIGRQFSANYDDIKRIYDSYTEDNMVRPDKIMALNIKIFESLKNTYDFCSGLPELVTEKDVTFTAADYEIFERFAAGKSYSMEQFISQTIAMGARFLTKYAELLESKENDDVTDWMMRDIITPVESHYKNHDSR